VGNLVDTAAREAQAEHLDLDQRDADVKLSPTGRDQADAVAAWVSGLDEADLPTTVLSSPYRRAAETAERAMRERGIEVVYDERLRERDLGIFDGLTGYGIRAQHPDEAARRKKLGKFYYQPPSGESWADVVLRVRSLLADLHHGYDDERIWMFTHQAVIMSFRYALEGLDEKSLLDIDREVQIPNASFTRFHRAGHVLDLDVFADTAAVDAAGTERTAEASSTRSGDVNA
jgi:broad specificity phosphatase PhoE